jgi:hypothetical protein
LEDGRDLRLLAGIGDPELAGSEPLQIRSSPTRFGRLDLTLEPLTRNSGTGTRTEGERVLVETGASSWEAVWKI